MERPTIHINGSSAKTMLLDIINAQEALRDAQAAIKKTAPHSRDYYVKPNGDVSYIRAVEEHSLRLRAIGAIIDELQEIGEKLL